jgi:hypothetical protein
MTAPAAPPAPRPPWATHVLIPTQWTPEQACAVFDLLTNLREAVASLYAQQLQDQMRDEQDRDAGHGAAGDDDLTGDHPF